MHIVYKYKNKCKNNIHIIKQIIIMYIVDYNYV